MPFYLRLQRFVEIPFLSGLASIAAVIALYTDISLRELCNGKTSLTLLYQNNLNAQDDVNHVSAISLDPMPYYDAPSACGALNERLMSQSVIEAHASDFTAQLLYLGGQKDAVSPFQAFWILGGIVFANDLSSELQFAPVDSYIGQRLPVLCTQSFETNEPYKEVPHPASTLTVKAGGNSYVGFRNKKSFRFLGIRYADKPKRFTHSQIATASGLVLDATKHGSSCLQNGIGSEDCLFLNIQTPYLPRTGMKTNLRPVHFWIHGGGFVGGTGSDPVVDGGDMASREDIVTVTINYRLSTLGFLAVPGTDVKGNFGIGDQIVALDWVVQNIAIFGGDPNRITIAGQSAGAGSVRTLLGSPRAIGKYAGAVAQSNLGGGISIAATGSEPARSPLKNYGTTYSAYLTVAESYAIAGEQIFLQAGCRQNSIHQQLACLEDYNGDITAFDTVARYVVQDGSIVVTNELSLQFPNPNLAHIPVIFGIAADDGASIVGYSKTCTTFTGCISANVGIPDELAQRLVDSGLFPLYDTGDLVADAFNVSVRIVTDSMFRCVDQATVFAGAMSGGFSAAYYYDSARGYPHTAYNPHSIDVAGPIEAGFTLGNPNKPYYRVHSADLAIAFGNVPTLRDENDLRTIQLTTAYFGEFLRSGQPNPDERLLKARGYESVLEAIRQTGKWMPVTGKDGPIKVLDWPARTQTFIDMEQCRFLGYPIEYYLDGSTRRTEGVL